jgi:hypothetical protein
MQSLDRRVRLVDVIRRHLVLTALAILLATPLLSVIAYDLVLYRVGYWQTAWCEKASTLHTTDGFWGPTRQVGDRVDLSRSSDYTCPPCSITFERAPRIVLSAVEARRRVVEPCPV